MNNQQSTINNLLLIIIVNYRTPDLTINCLRSLTTEIKSVRGMKVTIVDNASGDDSVAKIQNAINSENWQSWIELIASEYNGGFAFGNNLAIRPILESANPSSYFLLLNPDTEVRPGGIKALVDFMEAHPQVGIAGSSFEQSDGTPWSFAFRFPSILSELDSGLRLSIVSKLLANWLVTRKIPNEECQVDWLPGASMMIRRQVFESAGLMDEGYFLYYEETDYCLQAKRAGWSCWYVPQSRVMHIGGQSTGVDVADTPPKRLPKYCFDSRRRYFVKNYGLLYAAIADLLWIFGFSLWKIRLIVQRKPNCDPPHYFWDFIQNSVLFKGAK